jgi:hypothetical protein
MFTEGERHALHSHSGEEGPSHSAAGSRVNLPLVNWATPRTGRVIPPPRREHTALLDSGLTLSEPGVTLRVLSIS